MKVLVCDDVKELADEIVEAVREGDPSVDVVEALAGPDLTGHLNDLFQRVEACLTKSEPFQPDGLVFNGYDLAVFDNNLTHLHMGGRLTAEAILGYVRAFSTVPYIISLNKNTDLDFDLRYLVGDPETRADVALNTPHLANRALWTKRPGDGKDGFAPWYWPKLQSAPDRRRRQIEFVSEAIDTPVLPALRFPTDAEALEYLSPVARGTLYPDAEGGGANGKRIEAVTFREVFQAWRRSIPVDQDLDVIATAALKGVPGFQQVIARVVAADVDHWIRRHVAAPQSMFVDLPHLLVRMPFLLGAKAGGVDHWNAAAAEQHAPYGLDQALYAKHLAPAKVDLEYWFSAPGFWWPILKKDLELNKLFYAKQEAEWVNAVFCEDRSAFVEWPTKQPGDSPVEFNAGFEGSWGQRYVARIPKFQYQPLSLLTVSNPA